MGFIAQLICGSGERELLSLYERLGMLDESVYAPSSRDVHGWQTPQFADDVVTNTYDPSSAASNVEQNGQLTGGLAHVVGSGLVETVAEYAKRRRRTIGQRIRRRRQERGLSQDRMAELLGIRRTDYWGYEAGRHEPVRYLPEIARILEVTVDELLGEESTAA
jgi:DNA-binding XRE family transcriptional regulator